jgi:hypothetical protein
MNNSKTKNIDKLQISLDLNLLDRGVLIKIINLYQDLSKIVISDELINIYEREEDNFKKELILIRINSILSDINKKKYIKKEIHKGFFIYYYENYTNIYIKNKNAIEKIMNNINDIEHDSIYIIEKEKNSYIKKKIENISFLEKEINNLKIESSYILLSNKEQTI